MVSGNDRGNDKGNNKGNNKGNDWSGKAAIILLSNNNEETILLNRGARMSAFYFLSFHEEGTMEGYDIRRNGEGYPDPTAYATLKKEQEEENHKNKRYHRTRKKNRTRYAPV